MNFALPLRRILSRSLRLNFQTQSRLSVLSSIATKNFLASGLTASQRSYQTLDFGGVKEMVYERSDFTKDRIQSLFKDEIISVLGYGPQGRAQSLNMKDHGLHVVIGLRKNGNSWNKAIEDGWIPDKNLLSIEEACEKGNVVMNLLSDAAQKELWSTIRSYLTPGKTLYFSHGFSVVYKDQTKVIPPKDIDVVLVAPKGSGTTVRNLFLEGRGINSSFAVHQDSSGQAKDRTIALGVAIGSGYLYETSFEKEVYSDLTGERGVLMGAIYGLFLAQYEVLRKNGHSPSEAFNETVEEATQSLYPLIGDKGMDWMYANCSTTAQRGALDWYKPFQNATQPLFEKLYQSVKNGDEAKRSIEKNSSSTYRQELEEELKQIRENEMWRAGQTVRSLRPENNKQ